VVSKVCRGDSKGFANSFQGIRGYFSVMTALKFDVVLKNNRGTYLIGGIISLSISS